MPDPDTSLSEELAAEIQVGLDDAVTDIERRRTTLDTVLEALQNTDLRRDMDRFDGRTTIAAISTHSRRRPAFSSMLTGTAAVAIRAEVSGSTIHEIESNARSDIRIVDFIDAHKNAQWIERELAFELVTTELQAGPDIILLDTPLTITRQEFLTRKDSPVWKDWETLKDDQSAFWEAIHEEIAPWVPDGPAVIGWTRPRSSLLFAAFSSASKSDFAENLTSDLVSTVREQADRIEQVGPHRVLKELLRRDTRTIAYPYQQTQIDRRWEPAKLQELGVQGVFGNVNGPDSLAHFELPGSADRWTEDRIDKVLEQVAMATWLEKVDLPVPLWYTRKECEFPDGVLDSYYAKLKRGARDGDL